MKTGNNGKRISLELIRIIAIILVIFNHTGKFGYEIFMNTDNSILRLLSIFLDQFCKAGVPLFFMISGATLLIKNESIKDLFTKRVLRMVIILLSFSFIYYLRLYIKNPEYGFSITYFIKYIYSNPIITPFWFIYLYIAFLIMLPFLRALASKLSNSEFVYLIVLGIIFPYLSVIEKIAGFDGIYITIDVLSITLFYPLIGYFISNRWLINSEGTNRAISKINGKMIAVVSALAVAINYLACLYMMNYEFRINGLYSENYISKFVVIPTLIIFVVTMYLYDKKNVSCKLISFIGSCTFCVYLFEEILRIDVFMPIMERFYGNAPGLILCVPYTILVILTGSLISFVLKKIPFLKKLGL